MNAGLTVLKALASSCSVVMILSSAPALYRIHKLHDTGDVALFPLVGLWLNCCMVMLYGWTTGSYFPLFATYVFGTMISTAYVGVYFRWTKARAYALKIIGAAFIANILGSVYVVLGMTGVTGQPSDQVELIAGNMMTVACLLPYVAPFETIKTVLKTRSGASIPFGMCLAGATSNLIWTVEGLCTKDMFILLLSAACSALGFVQVALYLIFRPAPRAPRELASAELSVSTDEKYILPVFKVEKLKSESIFSAPSAVELIPPRCSDKVNSISSPVLAPLCIS
ncbi:hypothetical protein PF005_g7875 [Phytophthora fragariae]|uniref:MtN3-like protein n=1 Tax=Phytophthora fragariae TaxID=53985 RepID=A0A6A3STQ8_9STRA|nr:hypothetical protein PF003_g26725 [Phytophthora fragariae]KAE8941260.1 hypothetical protein PF009_g8957 [Phytophthora fragariae]KAE9015932.1 hypothetical protein PF011_g7390 [Phytophthora fragariae]KAE9119565.1 hypothetical protein PF010_g7821 [Phytophthora fragariae]KAE9120867.1 hypothetical protein PF007_g8017 [Phytophthora fragariae]